RRGRSPRGGGCPQSQGGGADLRQQRHTPRTARRPAQGGPRLPAGRHRAPRRARRAPPSAQRLRQMKKTQTRWVERHPQDFGKAKAGKIWKIRKWDHVRATWQDQDGKTVHVRPNPHAEVTCYKGTMSGRVRPIQSVLGRVVIEEGNTSE